jgi:xylulokinase
MTGAMRTTASGLSEAVLWDFLSGGVAREVLEHLRLPEDLIPRKAETFSPQGELTAEAAETLGLRAGIPVAYRAGDQPNNAFSLGVLRPGQMAATAGTSGVIYGVTDRPASDPKSRVNTFVHVNHKPEAPRFGVLLCVNGTGSLYRWLRHNLSVPERGASAYERMDGEAERAPAGSARVSVLPFGNGAERTLENRNLGASVHGLDFNAHGLPHLLRASQEGIVFAFRYGVDILRDMDMNPDSVRAGRANLFLSPLFARTFATVMDAPVELYNADGAQGAARGAGVGAGFYKGPGEAFPGLRLTAVVEPNPKERPALEAARQRWLRLLQKRLR